MKYSFSFLFLLSLFLFVFASVVSAQTVGSSGSRSFGGKIISITIPSVYCPAGGTLAVLSTNISSIGGAAASQFVDTGATKAYNTAKGIYGAIPYYTQDFSRVPVIGSWILGKTGLAPSLDRCYTQAFGAPIPIPVFKTMNYNVSKGPSF